jgi:hypothetical protein
MRQVLHAGASGLLVLALELVAVVRWRGAWRALAALPGLALAAVVLRIVVDVGRDPTSHNLWPFEVALTSMGALAVLGVLFAVRAIFARARRSYGPT